MVLDYYNLREQPFGVSPDSRFLFLGATHREALASLLYGVEAGCGFVALIAKPGLGKTTLIRHTLHQLRDKARTVFLFQTICSPADLLRALLTDLGVDETQGSLMDMQLRLNEVLVEQSRSGKRLVIVIDEAQNLDDSVLELVRMLSNFETAREKLLQIILSGQPELADKIGSPQLVQLRQRISIFACLKPFSPEETALYIGHRLRIAGYGSDASLFSKDALALIAECSEGIPRNINNLCFNALSLGCALKRKVIDCDVIREVVADLDIEPWRNKSALALRPVDRRALEAPAASAPSLLAGWLPKFAVASAVLFALGGVLFASHRSAAPTAAPTATVQAKSVVPQLVAPAPPSLSVDQTPKPGGHAGRIQVAPGQTLFGICVEHFGTCGPELMQKIQGLNPGLNNLNHIESGQTIRIPVAGGIQSIVEQPSRASLAEGGTQ